MNNVFLKKKPFFLKPLIFFMRPFLSEKLLSKSSSRALKFSRLEKRIILLNYISVSNYFSEPRKNIAFLQKDALVSSIVKKFGACLITGNSRSFHKDFNLSRIQLRFSACYGLLNGVTKSSW